MRALAIAILVVTLVPAPVVPSAIAGGGSVGSGSRSGRLSRLRQRAVGIGIGAALTGLATLGNQLPLGRPGRYGVRVERNIPYRAGLNTEARNRLDLFEPPSPAAGENKLPVAIYLHGGGFTSLSKETHRAQALALARRGYLVFNVDYRLAPGAPYPAAIEDACDAYRWVVDNAERFGGDLSRLIVAGESAGANLAASLAVAASYKRPEPWARRVFESGVVPRVVWTAAPALQVSDPERTIADAPGRPNLIARDRIHDMANTYLAGSQISAGHDLADPLPVLERAPPPERPLPAFFTTVGGRDPLLSHAHRLEAALRRLKTPVETHVYPGQGHAFHAVLFRDVARRPGTISSVISTGSRTSHHPGRGGRASDRAAC